MQRTIFILIYTLFVYVVGYSVDLDFIIKADSVKCYNGSSGSIRINILSGNPGYIIKLYNKKPATKQKYLALTKTDDTAYTFGKLAAGNYYVTIDDSQGNYLQKTVEIYQPEQLKAGQITVEQCFSTPEMNDAILRANCSGGTEPYSYQWSENTGNQTSRLVKNITRGTYRCVINDKNKCGAVSATIFFNEQVYKDCFSKFE
jgi:hypothetical protein